MKRKELLWMIVPCLLFAGVAWWLRPREIQSMKQAEAKRRAAEIRERKPFRLIIQRVVKSQALPREVAEGFDTKVVVDITHEGKQPAWWGQWGAVTSYGSYQGARLYYADATRPDTSQGKPIQPRLVKSPKWDWPLNVMYYRPTPWEEGYQATFLMALRDVPPSKSKVVLRASLAPQSGANKLLCPPVNLNFVVRDAGQQIKMPSVSRDSFLQIRKVVVAKLSPATQKTNGGWDTEVYVQYASDESSGLISTDTEYQDQRGHHLKQTIDGGGSSGSSDLTQRCRLSAVPPTEANLYCQIRLTNGDFWPLELRFPLRENGKDLKGTLDSSQYIERPASPKETP